MSSSAPVAPPSGNPEGDTTRALATPVPYSSEGPTLPLMEGVSEHSGLHATVNASGSSSKKEDASRDPPRASKKRKTAADENTTTTASPTSRAPNSDNAPLYSPWTLLSPAVLRAVEHRRGSSLEEACVSLVYTKNQNVKSGVNRLKAYLGYDGGRDAASVDQDIAVKLGRGDVLIAVSARGEGTTKLVGIVDVARRVVSERGDGAEGSRLRMWYMYTSLTGRVVQKRDDGKEEKEGLDGDAQGDDADEEDFETKRDVKGRSGAEGKERTIPVLTIWMSKKSVPEFKRAFGEQTFDVVAG